MRRNGRRMMLGCLAAMLLWTAFPGRTAAQTGRTVQTKGGMDRVELALPAEEDALLEGYLDQLFAQGRSSARKNAKRVSTMSAYDQKLYNALYSGLSEIAAGKRTSTVITVPVEDTDIVGRMFTAAQLGVSTLGTFTDGVSDAAANALYQKVFGRYHSKDVLKALSADCPYELYWYDKTAGCRIEYSGFSYSGDSTQIREIGFSDGFAFTFNFVAAEDYRGGSAYEVNTAKTSAASQAVTTVKQIVASHAAESDFNKLLHYRDEINKRVVYDTASAQSSTRSYGDPWQLIYVFDGNDATNVVCEGYSKAFQYLCDQSDFEDSSLESRLVTGTMSGGIGAGSHMWNVVTIHQKNYLADVTNSDDNSIGSYGDKRSLFLAGASGSVSGGYTAKSVSMAYHYDSETLALYSTAELTLSDTAYTEENHACVVTEEPTWNWASDNRSATPTFRCSVCGKWTEKPPVNAQTETKAAACETDGSIKYVVSVQYEGKTYKGEKTVTVPKLGHDYKTVRQIAKDAGNHLLVCSRDAAHTKTEAHVWEDAAGVVTKEATAAAPGLRAYTCSKCGYRKEETIPAKGTQQPETKPQQGDDTQTKPAADVPNALAKLEAGLLKQKKNAEAPGASFAPLKAKGTAASGGVKLTWSKVGGAESYVIYGGLCGQNLQRIASGKKTSLTVTKLGGAALTKGAYYRFVVAAVKNAGGAPQTVAVSKTVYAATSGGKVTNPKKITVSRKKIKVKVNKKAKIKAKIKQAGKKKLKLKKQRGICYESLNPAVAVVNAKGQITGKKKGTAQICVYAQNGVYAVVKVTVK